MKYQVWHKAGVALLAALCMVGAKANLPPVFVLNSLDADISIIDQEKWVEVQRIPTWKEPRHL